jgi:hypothetical protein
VKRELTSLRVGSGSTGRPSDDSTGDPYRRAVHDAAHAAERNEALVRLSCSEKQDGVEWKDAKCSRVKVVSVMSADAVKYWKGKTSSE